GHDRAALRYRRPRLLRGGGPPAWLDRGAEPPRRATALRADLTVDRDREHPAPDVRALRRGDGDRDRDEELHQDHARLLVGYGPARRVAQRNVESDPAAWFFEGGGFRQVVALAVAHAEVQQGRQLGLGLDALGDDRHVHLVGERDECRGERTPAPIHVDRAG